MSSSALRATAASLVALFLVSCGHSGGGGGSGTPVNCPTDDGGSDTYYSQEWHLTSINAAGAWTSNKGTGIRIAVVDDGLEIGHEDLCQNIAAGASYNYLNGSSDPTGGDHGTSVAGVAAARDLNNRGVRGVAPRALLVGYNILMNPTASNEADAMVRGKDANGVSSNSWGAPDGRGSLDAPDSTWVSAINTGITTGRGGKGTVYVWAGGNGAPTDNSNYDGQANNRGVIAVAAVNPNGKNAAYSEQGANLWVSAPAGEWCGTTNQAITTVDRTGNLGFNTNGAYPEITNTSYTQCFNGTSAATPVVSGVVALMLEANPNLTWRDVKLILAETAQKNDATDPGWLTSPSYHFNHKYGFGVVDAQAAVAKAPVWNSVAEKPAFTASWTTGLPIAIPDNNTTGVSNTINVTGSNISFIEFIEITFSAANHPYSGDLEITLSHNAATTSQLAAPHGCYDLSGQPTSTCTPYSGWVFGSARHLGEAADGNWTLTVKDRMATDTGTFQSWSLKFYGH